MNSPYDLDDLDELDGADLTQRFNRSLSGLQFDPDALAAGAMGAGRPLRRRRRLVTAVAGVAAAAMIGTAGACTRGPG